MIANPTTLILGAGASWPRYPLGSQLRQNIISGFGAEPYEKTLTQSESSEVQQEKRRYESLKKRFRDSHITSIDAFLAEPENENLAKEGHIAIAAALLKYESNDQAPPDWYPDLFNAIRFRDSDRTKKLKVVTFNYDLSLEFFLFQAFRNAYGLSAEDAGQMFNAAVEIIHVYGDLGELQELSASSDAREYGKPSVSCGTIIKASNRIKIIGRRDETQDSFQRAFDAIREASFIAILGYGFDPLNNQNLNLQEAVCDKFPFATGHGMGSGARARLTSRAHQSVMMMGGKKETVREFLAEVDFLRWINEPGAQPKDVVRRIEKVFEKGCLPYSR